MEKFILRRLKLHQLQHSSPFPVGTTPGIGTQGGSHIFYLNGHNLELGMTDSKNI